MIAVVGLAILAAYTGVSGWQAVLTREALDQALSQQRAWVRVSISPDSPLTIEKDGATLDVVDHVTNVGNLPAQGVQIENYLIPWTMSTFERAVRAAISDCPDKPVKDAGFDVFPGETVDVHQITEGATRRRLESLPDGQHVDFIVITCISYWSGSIERGHETRAVFEVERSNGKAVLFDRRADRADQESLRFEAGPVGGKAD